MSLDIYAPDSFSRGEGVDMKDAIKCKFTPIALRLPLRLPDFTVTQQLWVWEIWKPVLPRPAGLGFGQMLVNSL